MTTPSGGTSDYAPEMIHAAAKGEPYASFVRPDARIPFMAMPDGVDVGASQLRYAHARAAHCGVPVHFRQGDALDAPYPDQSFDLVFTCVTIHELQPGTIEDLMIQPPKPRR